MTLILMGFAVELRVRLYCHEKLRTAKALAKKNTELDKNQRNIAHSCCKTRAEDVAFQNSAKQRSHECVFVARTPIQNCKRILASAEGASKKNCEING